LYFYTCTYLFSFRFFVVKQKIYHKISEGKPACTRFQNVNIQKVKSVEYIHHFLSWFYSNCRNIKSKNDEKGHKRITKMILSTSWKGAELSHKFCRLGSDLIYSVHKESKPQLCLWGGKPEVSSTENLWS